MVQRFLSSRPSHQHVVGILLSEEGTRARFVWLRVVMEEYSGITRALGVFYGVELQGNTVDVRPLLGQTMAMCSRSEIETSTNKVVILHKESNDSRPNEIIKRLATRDDPNTWAGTALIYCTPPEGPEYSGIVDTTADDLRIAVDYFKNYRKDQETIYGAHETPTDLELVPAVKIASDGDSEFVGQPRFVPVLVSPSHPIFDTFDGESAVAG